MNTNPLSNLLTKTDYKLARECPTKLYYAKMRYSSLKTENDYFERLKEGGHIVGEMARVVHPGGILIGLDEGLEPALLRTRAELEKENATLFEAVFEAGGMLAVVDVLEKKGSEINLMEVKSKSYDSREEFQITSKKGELKSEWQPYIEDIAFQALVIKKAYPELAVTPHLLLPDKAKSTAIDNLASFFQIDKSYKVQFTGDRQALSSDHFLTKVNVKDACDFIMPLVTQEANRFVSMINPKLKKIQYHLGKHCKDCEFRNDADKKQSGYHECWGALADVTPHIFELYYGGALKSGGKYLFDEMIAAKKVSLFDIPDEAIKDTRGKRQRVQITGMREKREWVDPALKQVLEEAPYPLHFIDFETSTSPIPYHKGMRPYEQIAFQWSCHTIPSQGAEPVHTEWINLEDSFPSFKFAESLKRGLSPGGTIFMWANHENQVLSDVRRQMAAYGYDSPELAAWLDSVVITKESKGRLVDMNKLCLNYYFHPRMLGKTRLKETLPAVWNNNSYLWEIPFLKGLFVKGREGELLSPYESLEPIEIAGVKQVVREGNAAMTAYMQMMYGASRGDPDLKERWSKLLLQYCKLDTLAMVIVYLHWRTLLGLP